MKSAFVFKSSRDLHDLSWILAFHVYFGARDSLVTNWKMGRIPKKPHEVLFDGLQTDLKGLLMRFIATESVRYEEFAKTWRALNFPVIFYGIKNDEQLRTFTSEAFAISASSLVPPHDLQTRICAMYMLYGLYHTQLCTPKLKIRVDPETWKALMNLSKELKDQGHLDAAYILLKMHKDKIFQFTATLRHAIYTRHKTEDKAYERWKAGKELMTTTFNTDLLEQLHGLHNHYQQMKQDMGFQDNLSMKLVRESMADYIIQRIHAHQASDEDEDDSEQEREANPAQERAARIAMIKNKSFTTKGQGSSSQRHLQEAATSASEIDEKPLLSPNRPGRRGRKRTKKTPGRKKVERERPATEIEKKKAWSILPMRRLIDVDEEKEEEHDEDSDSDQDRKKRKSAQKSAAKKDVKGNKSSQKKQDKGKAKKMKRKKKKKNKKKRRKSETDGSTGESSWDDKSEVTGSATSGTEDTEPSPRKRRGRKRKRESSTSEAETNDGKKKGSVSDSDGQKDGWFESDGDELSSTMETSPDQKGKSPMGQTSQISFYDSDVAITDARSEGKGFTSLKRKRRGRPRKSVMPEEDIWSDIGNVSHPHQGGLVSDGGPNSDVHVDFRRDGAEAGNTNSSPPKKVLLGVKKTPRKDPPVQESGKGLTGQEHGEGKGLEKTQEKRKRGRKPKGVAERSPRKSSKPRKVVK